MKGLIAIGLLFITGCMQTKEKFEYLRFGEVKPAGWLKEQMESDLAGFTGHLDELVPALTKDDDIYGRNRLTRRDKSKDVGNIRENADWEVQYLWWNSETQSNWRDGQIRQAILTGNAGQLESVKAYRDHILQTQDSSGYLGIYDKNLRYRFAGENGELWAKATLLRGLLAFYESGTGDSAALLHSIERAVQDVMVNYPINRSDPFKADKSFAGICHGLVFTDVLDRLHQLTGKREYLDYAAFLYLNYSDNKLMEEDVRLDNIFDKRYKLKGHGVHTYEHLRPLAVACFATGDPRLKKALDIYLRRIDSVTTPTGGPIGDEWIGGRQADATSTGYEYCSLQELLDSYSLLMQKSGSAAYGDKIEKLFFNAAQGARHPDGHSIAYLKSDNSWSMTGPLNDTLPGNNQTRYKYSPVHQDVAVCCVPNAGRIAPYYVRSMWMRDADGLVAALYGPSVLKTQVGGRTVTIEQAADYPSEFTMRFVITLETPQKFTLKFRIPAWSDGIKVNYPGKKAKGYLAVRRTWESGDEVVIALTPKVVVNQDLKNDSYFTYGPLVLAAPIEGTGVITKEYPLPGLFDSHVKANRLQLFACGENVTVAPAEAGKLVFNASLINTANDSLEKVKLVPMGGTLLRQVTFRKQ
jgi:DUF1680 family protein